MPTLGNGPSVTFSGDWSFFSSEGQVGGDFAVPANGWLSGLHGYVSGDGTAKAATLVCWRGDIVIASVGVTVPASPGWCDGAIPDATVPITAGETLRLGWVRSQTNGFYDWSTSSGGTWFHVDSATATGWSGAGSDAGTIGAYADYSTGPRLYVNGIRARLRANGTEARMRVNGTFA